MADVPDIELETPQEERGAKEWLKFYLTSPLFWMGIGIRVIVVVILFLVAVDLNDMNELLLQANQNLLAGISPYSAEYTLTMPIGPVGGEEGIYEYPLSYPPVILVVYLLPTIVYPGLIGSIQFSPSFFVLNVAFTFWASHQFIKSGNRAESVIGWVYWLGPWWAIVEYMTFYSFLFTMMVLAFYHIDDYFRVALFTFLAIGAYHILIFILPVLLIYQIRRIAALDDESTEQNFLPITILKRSIQNLKKDWYPLKMWAVGILPTAIIFGIFLAWDASGMFQSLIGFQTSRFAVGILQVTLILVTLGLALSLLFVKDDKKLKFLATLFGVVTLIVEAIYLVQNDQYHLTHFYGLMVPLLFVLVKNIIYDLGIHEFLKEKFHSRE